MKFTLVQPTAAALLATSTYANVQPRATLRGSNAVTSVCTDLGEAAAEHVVKDNWCRPDGTDPFATATGDWPSDCRSVAVSVCQGTIPDVADRWCPDKNMKTSDMLDLMDMCEDQVDNMIDGGSDGSNGSGGSSKSSKERSDASKTSKSTKDSSSSSSSSKSSKNSSDFDSFNRVAKSAKSSSKGSSDFDSFNREDDKIAERDSPSTLPSGCGSDGSCGSCKQQYCPDVTERQECKDLFCSLEEAALFFPEDLVNVMIAERDSPSTLPSGCGSDGSCGSCKQQYCPDVTERQECKDLFCSLEEVALFFPEVLVTKE